MTKIILTLLLCVPARAERMVREGTPSTQTSIFVSSLTAQVTMGGSLVVNSSGTFGSSVTASSFFGDGSHLTGVVGLPATHQALTSGQGAVYTTPTNPSPRQLYVRCWGGGGGGAGSTYSGDMPALAVDGTSTTFSSVTANGGSAGVGASYSEAGGGGGAGGVGGAGSAFWRYPGGGGGNDSFAYGSNNNGGAGGGQGCGSGGAPGAPATAGGEPATSGISALDNSGGGGSAANSGGGSTGTAGGGGGGGECFDLYINSPLASTYIYTIGTGGAGAEAVGEGMAAGGNGGSGGCVVEERY